MCRDFILSKTVDSLVAAALHRLKSGLRVFGGKLHHLVKNPSSGDSP
jgi:hypothetical protein